MPDTDLVPVTYFPTPTHDLFRTNAGRIQAKPYARYFDGDMWLHRAALPALRAPMDHRQALGVDPAALNTLLDPDHHSVENGFCLLPDGTAYVASLVPFPGATGDMLQWWFWWFMVEHERYILWDPYRRVAVSPSNREVLGRPGLTHEQRYVGNSIRGAEYVGANLVKVTTRFVAPESWGLDVTRFAAADIVAQVCGEIVLGGIQVGRMLRLAHRTADGFELRSRFWLGDRFRLGARLDLEPVLRRTGLKRNVVDLTTAYEQLVGDQIGMTHLAGFLPAIYREFGTATEPAESTR
ncbi:hypothetical protein ABZS66_11605 [Dactylosporangium sp. NPDC005572]|uniref:DAPG hydrolase family protein n=1 Tax=Dactylosporangium sp. NPDC005572 TaxID=3156889 RepID=UPI0033BDCB0E